MQWLDTWSGDAGRRGFGPIPKDTEGTFCAPLATSPQILTMEMDLSPAWRPSRRGLAPFPALREAEGDGLVPNEIHHMPWAKRTLEEELSQSPNDRDAVWQSVLFLWRLEYLASDWETSGEGFRRLWQQYVSEWLVSRCVPV
jgi:hypothetical protein